MKTFVRCGQLFTGARTMPGPARPWSSTRRASSTMSGPKQGAPRRTRGDRVLDYSGLFVMPGLIDVHTHLAYGNAKSEEDIDLYSPLEFRALRGLFFAQKVAAAGFTAICSPGDAGQISLSIRNAIRAGLFDGPRVMAAGRYLTTHQGLTDWYPTWIGAPETSIGKLVTTSAEAVEEIRRQVKDGVDCIKIALDGIQRRENGELVAAFTQEETEAMVREIHRLGKKAVVHARGREATLYAARSGVDLIFHANHLDGECIAAMLETGSAIGPTLTHPRNTIDFTQPHEPAYQKGRPGHAQREYEIGCANWKKARAAGVPMMTGTDTGLCGYPLWRVECARARTVRRGSRLHASRGAARRDRGQCAVHDRRRPHRRARARPVGRFRRAGSLAARRYRRVAGSAAASAPSISPARRSASPLATTIRAKSPISHCPTGPISTPGRASPNCRASAQGSPPPSKASRIAVGPPGAGAA